MSAPSSLSQGLALLGTAVERERSGRPGHNAARLAEATGIERSRVSRVTQELRRLHYLERDETDVLSAGSSFFQTAGARNEPWLRAARAELRGLASGLEMTARVTVADGPDTSQSGSSGSHGAPLMCAPPSTKRVLPVR